MYLVRFGHFATKDEAEATLAAFKEKEKMNAVIAVSQAL